jgi:hypothetical protein
MDRFVHKTSPIQGKYTYFIFETQLFIFIFGLSNVLHTMFNQECAISKIVQYPKDK